MLYLISFLILIFSSNTPLVELFVLLVSSLLHSTGNKTIFILANPKFSSFTTWIIRYILHRFLTIRAVRFTPPLGALGGAGAYFRCDLDVPSLAVYVFNCYPTKAVCLSLLTDLQSLRIIPVRWATGTSNY